MPQLKNYTKRNDKNSQSRELGGRDEVNDERKADNNKGGSRKRNLDATTIAFFRAKYKSPGITDLLHRILR